MLPVITISRQFGSGGHEVGEKLARQLDVPFYDKALIAMAAKQSGLSEEVFANADEKATSSLLYSMVMGSYSFGARVPGINEMPINDKLFIIQSDIIKKAAAEGPCVIIGRCADYILREHENCLNVFVHASKEERVRRSVAKKDCEERKASDFVTKKDKQRANYYNFYSNKRWDDLQNYDITIDTSRFTVDEAVELLMDAAKRLDR
ncbi:MULTISPECIES: cytidylate kinase-like family protein [unclassified Acutalibacter]|jgi:cytidylate kinase|uniref:cytidylate kinase-like family protein n=1 Tax=unclassified Acutalibacter TaxID=2620728 RepID=UPI0014120046|nr:MULTISPECIES: cytidylate kinase-like family protein [unclassified Acutalibacter]MCI9225586.1 cytidylate kinase-like family protein [Acutalibacter sp.]NBJ88989.1 cytidylate kinase-like family protein [Acutalibacter sp. 1XD8-36]